MVILYYKCKLILGRANLFFVLCKFIIKYVNIVPDTNQENMLTRLMLKIIISKLCDYR